MVLSHALVHLADEPRWLTWRLEDRNGESTKVPYTSRGRSASSTNPATWDTLENCVAAAQAYTGTGGIGIVLGDIGSDLFLAGIDLDSCLKDGRLADWAQTLVDVLPTYIEISPSETGLKAFFCIEADNVRPFLELVGVSNPNQWGFKRSIPGFPKGIKHGPAVEIYGSHRYFAVTGKLWPGQPDRVATLDWEGLERIAELIPPARSAGAANGNGHDTTNSVNGYTHNGPDDSRSGIAMGIGGKIKRAGGTFEEMCDALQADPRTADWARTKGVLDGQRELHRIWDRADSKSKDGTDEDSIALKFAHKYENILLYCHDTGHWYQWDGNLWRPNKTALAFHFCRTLCREAGGARNSKTAAGVERFARADPVFAVTSEKWDKDIYLLGTTKGTVDLHTGILRPARQSDYITKSTLVAPSDTANCPLWLKFLKDATRNDKDLIRFLQQWCGYCLTGDICEHALLFIFGGGGNGKGVFLNTVARIFCDYATVAAMDTFTASVNDRHPTDLAMLRGARLVYVSETEEGRAWAENRIKSLTGGDPISARFMRQDFFTYWPQFKITVIGNHKPILRNVDDANRRRLNLAPFTFKPTNPDSKLQEKLEPEYPGILRWMIEGCLDWQANGLVRPNVVKSATAEYFADQDTIRQWTEDCCEAGSDTSASLYANYRNFAIGRGETPMTAKGFSQKLISLGFEPIKDTGGIRGRGFRGIKVRVYDPNERR